MKSFWRIKAVCIIVLLTLMAGMIGAMVHRARKAEAELALLDEDRYVHMGSLRPDRNLGNAAQFVKILRGCLDPNTVLPYNRSVHTEKVAAARALAISNLVTWLEEFSGQHYGTNVQAWNAWLRQQSPGAAGEGAGALSPGADKP